ncbi:MAG: hypothetical protein RL297_926 [Pseudomonadota bacterium]|jgi:hypothetical protein
MDAKILFPRTNVHGNILWSKAAAVSEQSRISGSLTKLRALGYWASPFPEGGGVAFSDTSCRSESVMLDDFVVAFDWLNISIGKSGNGNFELANLEADSKVLCTVIVPLTKIKIETTFEVSGYRFVCRIDFDDKPHERLSDFEGEYLEFKVSLLYQDLLLINSSHYHNNILINKCLALAENAMDLIRHQFSNFIKSEFTPNPAGQLEDGFYSIEIIPEEGIHLKPISLTGISRPFSVSNNWLGPEVEESTRPGTTYLAEVLGGRSDELAKSVKSALRACRQSFYSLGDESRFLNLVFTLDGLVAPEKKWREWKHRTFMSALISGGKLSVFRQTLVNYDKLYSEVRNKLVHGGADFYELPCDSAQATEDIFQYIKDLIVLVESMDFKTTAELHEYAIKTLNRDDFVAAYEAVISEVNGLRGKTRENCSWVSELRRLEGLGV